MNTYADVHVAEERQQLRNGIHILHNNSSNTPILKLHNLPNMGFRVHITYKFPNTVRTLKSQQITAMAPWSLKALTSNASEYALSLRDASVQGAFSV